MPSDELYMKHVKATEPDIGVVWHTPAGFTLADVRRLYMRLWLRHEHKGHPAPKVAWTAEDDEALRACAAVVKENPNA